MSEAREQPLFGPHRIPVTLYNTMTSPAYCCGPSVSTAICVCYCIAPLWDLRYSELPNFTTFESTEIAPFNGKQN